MMTSEQDGIPLSKVSPDYLHSNSTSHTWIFSAFAEIIDNAYDPDVQASELLINYVDIRNNSCIIFVDNGAGMDEKKLHKMLSFGYSDKESKDKHEPIGRYGNGFKSGSMRIGTDALVFTRDERSASIGFLSQTYLSAIKAESILVPILDYQLPDLKHPSDKRSINNLNAILKFSFYENEEELKDELRGLEESITGTKVIIWNLKRLGSGQLELDFSSDPNDIRCPEVCDDNLSSIDDRLIEQKSEYKYSLTEYCRILYLRPRMKLRIRGCEVRPLLMLRSLAYKDTDTYKPAWLKPKEMKITFGFTCGKDKDKKEDCGLMLYYKNRLIKAFERVGCQKQPDSKYLGILGIAEVDYLQPNHIKQDFEQDSRFNTMMRAFGSKLKQYSDLMWNRRNPPSVTSSSTSHWNWVQCDRCSKWRCLPDTIALDDLPEKWYCRLNPDCTHNRCDTPEEPEYLAKSSTSKGLKKKLAKEKRQQRNQENKNKIKRQQNGSKLTNRAHSTSQLHLHRGKGKGLQQKKQKANLIRRQSGSKYAAHAISVLALQRQRLLFKKRILRRRQKLNSDISGKGRVVGQVSKTLRSSSATENPCSSSTEGQKMSKITLGNVAIDATGDSGDSEQVISLVPDVPETDWAIEENSSECVGDQGAAPAGETLEMNHQSNAKVVSEMTNNEGTSWETRSRVLLKEYHRSSTAGDKRSKRASDCVTNVTTNQSDGGTPNPQEIILMQNAEENPSHSVSVNSLSVQTDFDMAQMEALLEGRERFIMRFKHNVHRLLRIIISDPDVDVGDVNNIDQFVENLIRCKEQDSQ